MNWFEILKEAKTVQSQRQGMAPIDIQKPFKRVKDKGCYEKFVEIAKKVQASFPKSRETKPEVIVNSGSRWHGANVMNFYYTEPNTEDNFFIHTAVKIPPKGDVPDEIYCKAIEMFKNLRPPSGDIVEEVGNYLITCFKKGTIYQIEIQPKGASYDTEDTALILVAHYFEDEERFYENTYKLHKEFDNWSGFL